jgi:Uncharacterized conserved protein
MLDKEFKQIVGEIKNKIKDTQFEIVSTANKELLDLYMFLGKVIANNSSYGNKFVENLSQELKISYPNSTGFSQRNLASMHKLYKECETNPILQPLVAKLPWTFTMAILDKVKDNDIRIWYMNKTIENGWAKSVLLYQLDTDLYSRQVTTDKLNNFKDNLIDPQSELAEEMMKDPYNFDLPLLKEKFKESELENSLVERLKDTLLELGNGFSFLGNQYKINVDGDDFFIDMLFYHTKLHCHIVVELKTVPFQPEFTGKLNFYVSAVDDLLKTETDNPTIGILLCQEKKKMRVEYSLRDIKKPIGVASYKILPKEFIGALPTEEDINLHIEIDEK